MERIDTKSVAALLQALIILSRYEKDEAVKRQHTEIISRFCSTLKHLPRVRDIENADPLQEFARITDESQRQTFIRILLQAAYQDAEQEKHLYIARLLAALDR